MIKKKILVVEDERLIALEIATRLQRLGFNVCYDAVDAEEAIMQVRNFEPDMILMDIKIGGNIDGIETAKKFTLFPKLLSYLSLLFPMMKPLTEQRKPYHMVILPSQFRKEI